MSVYLAVIIMVHIPFVQRWLGSKVQSVIEDKLDTKVVIGKVYLGFLNRIIVDNLELYDKKSELMVKASRLAAKIDYTELIKNGRIYISSAQVFGMKGVFYKDNEHAKPNFQFVLDSLASKDKSKKSNIDLSINSLIIRHGAIRYDRLDIVPTPARFNINHIDVKDISGHLIIPYYTNDSIALSIKNLAFKEASGLNLKKLKFNLVVNRDNAELTGFELTLPNTDIQIPRIIANYETKNGKPSLETLHFYGVLDKSRITLHDAACFLPAFQRANKPLYISTSFAGTEKSVNLKNVNIQSHNSDLNVIADGSLNKYSTTINWEANIKHFGCTASGIDDIIKTFTDGNYKKPDILTRVGNIEYAGKISGSNNSISTNGQLKSGIGNVTVRLGKNGNHISAYLNTDNINLGTLLDNDKFGLLATTITVDCDKAPKGFSNIQIDGTFPRFDYNGYSYKDIAAKGTYSDKRFNGTFSINDPNGQVSVNGNMDLGTKMQTTDIEATIRNLDLAALRITDKWKGAKFDLDISADTYISEKEANLFKGEIEIRNFSMYSDEKTYSLDNLTVTAENNSLIMKSDFGHAELSGRYKLLTIAQSFANLLHSKFPTLCAEHDGINNQFTFKAEINDTQWLNTLFNIPLQIDEPLNINAQLDDNLNMMGLSCNTGKLTYDGSPYENISIIAGTSGDTLSVDGKVRKVMDNGHRLDLRILANAMNDRLSTSIQWDNNQQKVMSGELNAETRFIKSDNNKSSIDINIKPSHILINDTIWNVLPANINYRGGDLAIDHFSIEHGKQHIRIDGMATKHPSDSITIDMQDVNVGYILNLVNFHSVEFDGNMTGKAYVKSVFYDPDAYANLTINNFLFENGRLGKLLADVNWNKNEKQIDIDAHAYDTDNTSTVIKGYVSPTRNHIDLGIRANGTNIEFLHSFCDAFMDDINAKANGEVRLHGPLNAMNLTGKLVADGNMVITPINVRYHLENDTIRFLPDNIVFRADTIRDRNGNIGIVNGALHHKNLSHLTYDINIKTNNLLCYDTNSYDEDSFYGTAYGTGTCNIQGRDGRIDIDIDITPEENSFIEYNAASPEAVSDQQFIKWRDRTDYTANIKDSISHNDSTKGPIDKAALFGDIPSDMRINFLIDMTPKATLRVLMDKNTNDYIALNGNGTIRASYFNKGSFDMFGTFLIDHGLYTLTIQNIIKKVFQFQRGGTIVFGGDPYDALLDLQAIYTVNGVPLSDLQLGNSFSSNNVRVDCLMNISGTPQSPHVDFNIDLPTVNEDAEQMVRTVINSEEEMNQQVVYLLSVGRFYIQNNNNSPGQSQNQTSLAMQSLLSGTISQQINTLLGSLVKNNNWTFGANISTGNEGFNNAEYEGLLSGRLLNNRLIINGQFGYRDNANATTSFIGDFDVNYLLLPNGNISLKVYNQTNDRYFTKSSLNTQGIGLILKKDFNSLMELFGFKRKRKPLSISQDSIK